MTIHALNTPVVLFNHREHGERLLFKNAVANTRNELGKYGVYFHNILGSMIYSTIAIEANLLNKKGKSSKQVIYVNRNSLVKYLGVRPQLSDKAIIAKLKKRLWKDNSQAQINAQIEAGRKLQHVGHHNQSKVLDRPIWQRAWTMFVDWLYHFSIGGSLTRMLLRVEFVGEEKSMLETSEQLAKKRFDEAYHHVPAYQKHVYSFNQGKFDPNMTFKEIPVTNKSNYIKVQEHDEDTHFYGKYPANGKTDTSTGTTGKPTVWVRSQAEVDAVKKSLQIVQKLQFGGRKMSYINAFALGPWATGLTSYEVMRETGHVFATGTDKDKILDKLLNIYNYEQHQLDIEVDKLGIKRKSNRVVVRQFIDDTISQLLKRRQDDFDKVFEDMYQAQSRSKRNVLYLYKYAIREATHTLNAEKQQVVVAGYPPFLKDLIAYIQEQGHDFAKFSAVGIVGGQAMSEAMRDQLTENGFHDVYSSYGASDLDINLGVETDAEIKLRKAIEENPGIGRELFGAYKGLPMIFNYDPLNYHIECDDNGYLIFTCVRNDRSSPRIRYNLGDEGRVYASSDVGAVLAKYGIKHNPKTNLPLMFIWGRDSMVVYNGANLAFTNLERAIHSIPELEEKVLKKAFYTYEDEQGDEQMEMWLELNEHERLPSEHEAKALARKMFSQLASSNQDFRFQLNALDNGTALPKIRFFARHESPISEAGGHRKQVLVFKKGVNIADNYQFPAEDKCKEITLLKDESLLHDSKKKRGIAAKI